MGGVFLEDRLTEPVASGDSRADGYKSPCFIAECVCLCVRVRVRGVGTSACGALAMTLYDFPYGIRFPAGMCNGVCCLASLVGTIHKCCVSTVCITERT